MIEWLFLRCNMVYLIYFSYIVNSVGILSIYFFFSWDELKSGKGSDIPGCIRVSPMILIWYMTELKYKNEYIKCKEICNESIKEQF